MDNLNFSRLRAEEQNVFINTFKWGGIQDISINSNFGAETTRYLGIGSKREYLSPKSEQYADVNIDFLMLSTDMSPNVFTENFSMFILPNEKDWTTNYSLIGGYLNSYSVDLSVGTIPRGNANIRFYTNAGQLNTGDLSFPANLYLAAIPATNYSSINTGQPYIPHSDSIVLTLDEYTTNRVQNFSFQWAWNHIPVYNIGSKYPTQIKTISPIETNINFTFECNVNQSGIPFRTFPSVKKEQNISFQLKDYETRASVSAFSFQNMTLTNEVVNSVIDDNVSITRNYKGYTAV